MKICLVYDCLYPHTIGGAERWYRNLAQRLVAEGHELTYLTMRQWDRQPNLQGVRVIAVAPGMALYTRGRRRILPPLVFGAGVAAHLALHGRDYDAVHTASFPYFSLLAAAMTRRFSRFQLVVDWHEVWTRKYWSEYLGRFGGFAGHTIQRRCLRIPQRSFCFSRLHASRLRDEGVNGTITILEGEYDDAVDPPATPAPADPLVVFAGRHIPEKRVPTLVAAVAAARARLPSLQGEIYGDGPDRPQVLREIRRLKLEDVVSAPGFVDESQVDAALRRALCLMLPSSREGYGLVVVESSARGTPSVLVAGADNAAAELVAEGENGFVSPSASAEDLAEAIVRVHEAGYQLREATLAWFKRNRERLSLENSLQAVAESYVS